VIYRTATGSLASLRAAAARELDALDPESPAAFPPDLRAP
jgi:hypothetical protein